jgi:predicted phage terminase large subunit-like protein
VSAALRLSRLLARKAEIEKSLAEKRMSAFIKQAWPYIEPGREYFPNWHIDAICEHLEAVIKRQVRFLIINIPPRHLKSITVSVAMPAWTWIPANDPHHKFLCGSYALSLAVRDQMKTRKLCQSPYYTQRWPENFCDGNTRVLRTLMGGERIVTAVDAGATGQGGDTILIDDPHNIQDVTSDPMRNAANDWIGQVMSTRLNVPQTGAIVVIMQRSHEKDATGYLLEQGGWEHLMLPTEFEPQRRCVTVLGFSDPRKEPGELLFPTRMDEVAVARMKVLLGSYGFAGQHQQRPAPAEGGMFKKAWWRYWNDLAEIPSHAQWTLSVDCAFKDDKDTSSYVVVQAWARDGARRWLVDQIREHLSFVDTLAAITSMLEKWPECHEKLVEDKANGTAVIDTLRRRNEMQGLIAVEPHGGKMSRAMAVQPQIEAGNVYLPNPSKHAWVDDYVNEWSYVPLGEFWDQIDASTQYLHKHAGSAVANLEHAAIGTTRLGSGLDGGGSKPW